MLLLRGIFPAIILGMLLVAIPAQGAVKHKMVVSLDPANHTLEVEDRIELDAPATKVEFILHANLRVESPDARVEAGPNVNAGVAVPLSQYHVMLAEGQRGFTVRYHGTIHHPVAEFGEEYARSFGETPGTISSDGVFLAQTSFWYPYIEDQPVTFDLETRLPPNWESVSQGQRLVEQPTGAQNRIRWTESTPQEEIYLIAAPFHVYTQAAGAAQAMVYLRDQDEALARKYLEATAQYLEMYRQLIGPYPYAKFALVENFWETGYGMPSFTLLGSKVLRLPFIIHSSYPHEILHNYWGNGVYVDYATGNWAEGLTAYLADHLIQEQRGLGDQHRRQLLQHYADFVDANKDFPLTDFRSRHSSVTEVVGYGKTQMLFHMLRRQMGDQLFEKALHQFFMQYKFKTAGFDDLQRVFSRVAEIDFNGMFDQWVKRTGSPQLVLRAASAEPIDQGFRLTAEIEQIQDGAAYVLDVPVAISLEGEEMALETTVAMRDKRLALTLDVAKRPVHLAVDPQFDLFRRLDRDEIPAALSRAFGADQALLVLPANADASLIKGYRELADEWQNTQESGVEVKLDNEIASLPDDRAVWLFGWTNRFLPGVNDALGRYNATVSSDALVIASDTFLRAQHAVVVTAPNPGNPQHAIAWVATDNVNAIAGLGRKLPHYRKYSYLAFTGDEPTNTAKGQWPVDRSPMQMAVTQKDNAQVNVIVGRLAPRTPLAQLPPVFDEARMMNHVRALTADEMDGRGLGSEGLEKAASYLAGAFRDAGLAPGFADSDSYIQEWTQHVEGLDRDVTMKNIIGVVPGADPKLARESVVIGAHYDHLGRGWPDVRAGNEGAIHHGADDNASGLAVMLELARMAASEWKPERTLVFVAFTGEEAGKLGSQYYVKNYDAYPAAKAIALFNLDTVGRLGSAPVTIFGTGTAREWVHIFRGAQFVTGVNVNAVADDFGSGDQTSFIQAGVPSVQLFGSVHGDFHSPRDTADKVDSAGLVKVAAVLKEAAEYLSSRPEPLSATISNDAAKVAQSGNGQRQVQGRRVSVGTVPDFAYGGPGVRITDVVVDSPAARAGLRGGDIIVAINREAIDDLAGYARLLRDLMPGATVALSFNRDGQRREVELQVLER